MPATLSFTLKQARRLALAAQGFDGRSPPASVQPSRLNRLIERLGVLQIDSVNALVRSHYLRCSPASVTTIAICSIKQPGARADVVRCSNTGDMKRRCCRCRCIR